jgi:hypothetical protein
MCLLAITETFILYSQVDGKVHIGQGLSKPLAKQNAAENALKALLLEKMAQAAIKVESSEVPEPLQEDTNNGTGSTPNTEGSDEMLDSGKPETPEDDVPWGSLASFALYKLFTDWQSQGTHVPIPKQTTVPATKQVGSMQLAFMDIHSAMFSVSPLAMSNLALHSNIAFICSCQLIIYPTIGHCRNRIVTLYDTDLHHSFLGCMLSFP